MGDQEEARPAVPVDLPHQLEHGIRRPGVEIARRLVRQHEVGLHGERARHRNPLLLAARHVVGEVAGEILQPDLRQQPVRPGLDLLVRKATVDEHGHHDVLPCGEGRDQEMVLEHEADGVAAQMRDLGIAERGGILPLDQEPARGRPVEQADDVEQGALARAGRADQREELAVIELEVDVVQHLGLVRLTDVVGLADLLEPEDFASHGSPPPDRAWRRAPPAPSPRAVP